MTSRLLRATYEMEGRVQEVWTLVDEDDQLEQWPANEELSIVGRDVPRQDGPVRASGRATFTVDVRLPGMLQAAILRSPVAHARVRSIDLDAARRADGVRAVIGPDDPFSFTPIYCPPQRLVTSEPLYAGQPIALVAADTAGQALAAIAAMALEIEALPHVLDPQQAMSNLQIANELEETRGIDIDEAFKAADKIVDFEVDTPDHLQAPLEPHAAVARWDGDELTVWLSTQGIFEARDELSASFGIPTHQVRVIADFVGGGFGAKQGGGFEANAAAELARRAGRPVRLANSRHEEQLDGGRRSRARHSVRLGARSDGTLVGVETGAVVDQGELGKTYFIGTNVQPALTMYACDNVRAMAMQVKTNRRGQNAFRAPGFMECMTVFDQAMDMLAEELGLDPLEIRRINCAVVDGPSGLPYSGKHLLACYDRAAELAGWGERERLREPQADGLLRGMGCGSQLWYGQGGPPAHVDVQIDAAGHALIVTGIQDVGTGTLTAARVVAAEELGLPIDDVQVVGGDTGRNRYSPLAGGSTVVPSVMPAVRAASAKARRILLQLASDALEISADDLELRDGRLHSSDGALDVPVVEVTARLGKSTVDASAGRVPDPLDRVIRTFGCQIAQVAVDADLGEVRVERIVAVHDVGRIINRLGATSQVEGGIVQALGFTLSEEVVLDQTIGAPVNAWLDDYKLPTIADVPEIVVDFIDIPDSSLPNTGSRGLGEPSIIPTAAAINNAFAHATGRRCRTLPLTRARVLEALA